MKLTGKQEAFAQAVASGKTQADAYREAYSAKAMKDETIWARASELMADSKVSGRVEALLAEIAARTVEKTAITREDLIEELEEARLAAMGGERPQAGAAVAATVAKGKLLGLQVDKVEHSGMVATMDVAAGLTDDQKVRASLALLERYTKTPAVVAFARRALSAQGYEFED